MRHKDMGKHSNLRDAYLFAAPILSDRDTVDGKWRLRFIVRIDQMSNALRWYE